MKIQRNYKQKNIISILTIVYGFVYIITDVFHYFYGIQATKEYLESGIMGNMGMIPYETIEVKLYNSFIHLVLILAGYSFYQRRPITWYLYNFSFIALILKFPTFLFWGLYYKVNWISSTGLPYIFSIVGLIYFNRYKVKRMFHYAEKRNGIRLAFFSVFTFLILSILSYNIAWTPRKQLTRTLNEAIVKNKISKYKYHIKNILDTVNVNWNNIEEIGIGIINNENIPIYIEKLAIGESDLLCFPIKHDKQGNLLQEFDPKPFYNCIIYKYDSLNRITTKKLCSNSSEVTFLTDYDTITNENNCIIFYKYTYFDNKIIETGFRSENDPFLKYELNKNSKGQIIFRKVINGYDNEGDIYYFYDEKGRKIKTEENDENGQLRSKELYYYRENKLIRWEEFYYGKTNLSEKLLNLIKLKSYSSKYITYYFTEKELLTNKR
jgi:hypothetical protein